MAAYNKCGSYLHGFATGCIHADSHQGLHMGSSGNKPLWWDRNGRVFEQCGAHWTPGRRCNRPGQHDGWHTLAHSDFSWGWDAVKGREVRCGLLPEPEQATSEDMREYALREHAHKVLAEAARPYRVASSAVTPDGSITIDLVEVRPPRSRTERKRKR
jgi:hypothetical protein